MESEEEEEYSSFSYQLPGSISELENRINFSEIKKKTISNEKWAKEINAHKINNEKMNQIIANYLFIQGYCLPLKKFISETQIKFNFDENLLTKRYLIRQLITSNQIEKAIDEINSIDKRILQENKIIHFILLRQKLINYIKENKLEEGLSFTKETLLPLTQGEDFLYKELEKTMCLLVYDSIEDAPERELITDKFLEKIASKVNLIILNYLSGDKMVNLNLELLIKSMLYVQGQLKSEIEFPQITSLSPLNISVVNK